MTEPEPGRGPAASPETPAPPTSTSASSASTSTSAIERAPSTDRVAPTTAAPSVDLVAPASGAPSAANARLSRRDVLRSAGVVAVGGLGVAAGYGLRGLVDPAHAGPGVAGAASPSASGAMGLVAAETGSPAASPAPPSVDDSRPRHAFRSRPDLRPPMLLVGTAATGTADGLLFTTPNNGDGSDGPTIYDESGQPVWVGSHGGGRATDLHVVEWKGAPALAWWEGTATIGVGDGDFVIADGTYREIARVAAGGHADLHELQLTRDGTALYLSYEVVPMPAEPAGPSTAPSAPSAPAPASGSAAPSASAAVRPTSMYDCVIREVDLAGGQVRFEWHAADHIGLDESNAPWPADAATPHDPVHANAVHLDDDGTVLLSARNTSCIYKIDRATGEIRWRFGGTKSDLRLLDGLSIDLQHDVRRQADGTLTIFDNGIPPNPARGLVVEVDETARTARLVQAFERPEPLQAASQGSVQVLANGNVLVGWGSQAAMTEFDPTGRVVFDASMPAGAQSYRDRRHAWTGRPTEPPAVAADPPVKASGSQWRITAYASWNGATEVRGWALYAGAATGDLERLSTMARTGFETMLTGVTTTEGITRVQAVALDADGRPLGESQVVAPA